MHAGAIVVRTRAPTCPLHLRHQVVPNPQGGHDLVTHAGYVLFHALERDDVLAYYARHCPQT